MYQQMIFVNLAVNDLEASKKFFTELGFALNEQFSDDSTASVVISDAIVLMIMKKERFGQFTKKQIADSSQTVEALLALSAESREKVDELVDKAIASGVPPPARPRSRATSCTAGPSSTRTVTTSRSSGWTRRSSRAEQPSGPYEPILTGPEGRGGGNSPPPPVARRGSQALPEPPRYVSHPKLARSSQNSRNERSPRTSTSSLVRGRRR